MSENNVNGITGADVATTTGIIGATIAIGQYIVNDYVITIAEAEGDYGYTMTITRGTETQTVTLYGLTQEQYDAMLGYLQQAQEAAQSAQTADRDAQAALSRALNAALAAADSESNAAEHASESLEQAGFALQSANDAQAASVAAQSAQQQAQAAQTAAETAAGQITGMTAEAETLAPGSPATASFLDGVLSLGIPAGANGNSIVSIVKTGTSGNVDTYTITYTNGTTSTFTVTNGVDGAVTSVAGKTGAVTLDAGDIEYDDTDTYAAGSVGAGLADLKSQIEEISQSGIDASGASDGQVPVADGQGSWAWDDPAGGGVSDVQVNGVSVVTDGVANVPLASGGTAGAVYIATSSQIAVGSNTTHAMVPFDQDVLIYFGLARAARAGISGMSWNTVGVYPEAQKSAISEMLNGSVTVTGTTPSITALPGVRYVCGEVSTIDITVPASGIVDIVFTSGSTPAVLTVTPPTGQTMKWANGFDPDNLDANTVYEISVMDGSLGVAGIWT